MKKCINCGKENKTENKTCSPECYKELLSKNAKKSPWHGGYQQKK